MKYLNLKDLTQAQRDEFISIWNENGFYTADADAGISEAFCKSWTFGAEIYLSKYADESNLREVVSAYFKQYANRIDKQISALLHDAIESEDDDTVYSWRLTRRNHERSCRTFGVELTRHIFGK